MMARPSAATREIVETSPPTSCRSAPEPDRYSAANFRICMLLARYAVSPQLAVVIAELAFDDGRRA
jgi:hypothetical protein